MNAILDLHDHHPTIIPSPAAIFRHTAQVISPPFLRFVNNPFHITPLVILQSFLHILPLYINPNKSQSWYKFHIHSLSWCKYLLYFLFFTSKPIPFSLYIQTGPSPSRDLKALSLVLSVDTIQELISLLIIQYAAEKKHCLGYSNTGGF